MGVVGKQFCSGPYRGRIYQAVHHPDAFSRWAQAVPQLSCGHCVLNI
jgi:hypothetical protein